MTFPFVNRKKRLVFCRRSNQMNRPIKQSFKNYFLGDLSPEDEFDFLVKCFESDESAEKYEIERDDLIESYLDDDLSARDRKKFERHFLSFCCHQEHFYFLKLLRQILNENEKLAELAQQAAVK